MASTHGRHYRDHRRVEERANDEERRHNINVRNNGLLGSAGSHSVTGSAGNSLSLEELFINGVGPVQETGNRYDHGRSAASTQDIIRLDHPRPDVLRARNEYVDVTRNVPSGRTRHRTSVRQSTGPFPVAAGRVTIGQTEDGLQPAHRAHSMPLSPSNAAGSPVMAPVFLDGGSSSHRGDHCACYIGRPLSSASTVANQVNFDRVKVPAPSKSAATLASTTNGCHPSTSSTTGRPPIPGRAIRVSNPSSVRNGGGVVVLPTSSVISSQPRNSSSNAYDKNLTGKRANDFCSNNEIDCRQPNGLFESSDCSSSSLMCKHCGRCRCAACTTPRTLPSRWICNNSCLLSSDAVVDAASCMCCVKGCLYHAGVDSDDYLDERYHSDHLNDCSKPTTSTSSGPSSGLWSCSPFGSTNCCLRWGILASAIACLPCIWCYLPMKACASGFESLYSRYHDHGCRCDRETVVRTEKQHSGRSSTRALNGGDRSLTRRLRRKRSHTLPPELPSIAAAKAAACNGYSCGDGPSVIGCRASEYS